MNANRVNLYQMPQNAAPDMGLHYFLRNVCSHSVGKYGKASLPYIYFPHRSIQKSSNHNYSAKPVIADLPQNEKT